MVRSICGAVLLLALSSTSLSQTKQPVLSLYRTGSGPVTIILESGAASDRSQWESLQPMLSPLGTVISYDRAGYGSSPRSSTPPTARNSAEQLRAALRTAGARPPFIIVGHSYGGAIARVFASAYPDELVGLVLVDPAMDHFYIRAAVEAPKEYLSQLDEDLVWADRRASETVKREYLAYETSMAQARLARPDPRDRVVILSAQKMELAPKLRAIWLDEQERYARSVRAKLIRIDGGHHFYRENPGAVVAAVQTVLNMMRAQQP